jgi:medium-chain acyl-[acyl-carrier-protein] hydrolase
LFCVPHAAGDPGFFRRWCELLAPDIDVCRIALPGREPRRSEPPATRMDRVAGPLLEAMREYTAEPYAVFGHSMGAAIGYEVVRRLSAESLGNPVRLFVSGRRAPHTPLRHPPYHQLTDRDLARVLVRLNGTPKEMLDEESFVTGVLPCVRADFELLETWYPTLEPRLRCAVSAFAGDSDPEVSSGELLAWEQVTAGTFEARLFSGDHFYLKGARPAVLSAIRDALLSDTLRSTSSNLSPSSTSGRSDDAHDSLSRSGVSARGDGQAAL